MKLNKTRFQQPARFELLPLIDVIFLLLIFFIFVMLKMTMQSSIKVDLPQLVETAQQTEEPLTITINVDNQIFIDEQNSALNLVVNNVLLLQKEKQRPILIRGDQHADLGIALTILDKLRQAGFKQVAFATEKDN
jgi:biopolymer transport protein ExbD